MKLNKDNTENDKMHVRRFCKAVYLRLHTYALLGCIYSRCRPENLTFDLIFLKYGHNVMNLMFI